MFMRFTRLKRTLRDISIGFILGAAVASVGGQQLGQQLGKVLDQVVNTVQINLGRLQ